MAAKKKKAKVKEEWAASVFQGLESALRKKMERRKGRQVRILSFGESDVELYPSLSFYMDYLLNSRGLPKSIYNLIGRDGTGKTSLLFSIMGAIRSQGHYPFYVKGEKKAVDDAWFRRCAARKVADAAQLERDLFKLEARSLDELWETICETVLLLRDPAQDFFISKDKDVVCFVDPLNKIATPGQAAGISTYDGAEKEEVIALADRGHMWDRSKFYHDMTQRMTPLMLEHNVNFFFGEHQNQDGVGGGGKKKSAFTPEYISEAGNRKRPGGEALNQTAGLQLTLFDRGYIYSAGEKVARRISISPVKSSHGPSKNIRFAAFAIKEDKFEDTADELDPCIRWDYTTLEWFAENGYFGVSRTGSTLAQYRYNIAPLGVRGLSLVEAAAMLFEHEQTWSVEVGHALRIPGYYDPLKALKDEG